MFGRGQRCTCGWVLALLLFLTVCFFVAQGCGSAPGIDGKKEIEELIAGERVGP